MATNLITFRSNEDIEIKMYFKDRLEWYEQLSEYDIFVHFKVDVVDDPAIIETSTVLGNIVITDDNLHEAVIDLPWEEYKEQLALSGSWLFDVLLINKDSGKRKGFAGGTLQLIPTVTRGNADE